MIRGAALPNLKKSLGNPKATKKTTKEEKRESIFKKMDEETMGIPKITRMVITTRGATTVMRCAEKNSFLLLSELLRKVNANVSPMRVGVRPTKKKDILIKIIDG